MAEPVDNVHFLETAAYLRQVKSASPEGVLKDGDGGGTSGGMEARLAKLEAHMEHVREDLGKLSGVPSDLAGMTVKVDNLPTKDYLAEQFNRQLVKTGGVIGIIAAIVGVVFHFVGK